MRKKNVCKACGYNFDDGSYDEEIRQKHIEWFESLGEKEAGKK